MAATLLLATMSGGAESCKRTSAGRHSADVTPAHVVSSTSSQKQATAPALAELTTAERALGKATTIPDNVLGMVKAQGKSLRRLEGRNEDDEVVPAAGVTIDVERQRALEVVRALRKAVGPTYFVFVSEQNFGLGGQLDNVSLLRSPDPYDAMRVMGTNADNYEMPRATVIAQLKKWDAAYGLRFRGVGFDWVEAEFVRKPSNMLSFAQEVYRFCPDVVDQGAGSVEKLAAEMARTNALYLWWD